MKSIICFRDAARARIARHNGPSRSRKLVWVYITYKTTHGRIRDRQNDFRARAASKKERARVGAPGHTQGTVQTITGATHSLPHNRRRRRSHYCSSCSCCRSPVAIANPEPLQRPRCRRSRHPMQHGHTTGRRHHRRHRPSRHHRRRHPRRGGGGGGGRREEEEEEEEQEEEKEGGVAGGAPPTRRRHKR